MMALLRPKDQPMQRPPVPGGQGRNLSNPWLPPRPRNHYRPATSIRVSTAASHSSQNSGAALNIEAHSPFFSCCQRSPLATPNRDGDPESDLPAFLKTITNLDLTRYQLLLEAQGLSVSRLRTIATWTPYEIHEGLERLLMDGPTGHPCIPALMFMEFEDGVPRPSYLPLPNEAATTMPLLLENVMGLDVSEFTALAHAQGFSISALDSMFSWDLARIQRKLKFTLLDPARIDADERKQSYVPRTGFKGMCSVEVLAIEFCLRRAADEWKQRRT
ncbi:hypothetical protein C8R45DRAFT_1219986 [Mycena sanguinolenta]|nr:hypothetical protein C8R45DRAFT_1219986 [Mycena sanguinolenta]